MLLRDAPLFAREERMKSKEEASVLGNESEKLHYLFFKYLILGAAIEARPMRVMGTPAIATLDWVSLEV